MPSRTFRITNNVTRAVFDFVRNNPGLLRSEIRNALVAQGYKDGSVTSIVSQLRHAGQITCLPTGTYHTVAKEYEPIKYAAKKRKTQIESTTTLQALATHKGVTTSKAVPTPINNVEHILNTLPIKQARALYDELHKIFGVKA